MGETEEKKGASAGLFHIERKLQEEKKGKGLYSGRKGGEKVPATKPGGDRKKGKGGKVLLFNYGGGVKGLPFG